MKRVLLKYKKKTDETQKNALRIIPELRQMSQYNYKDFPHNNSISKELNLFR